MAWIRGRTGEAEAGSNLVVAGWAFLLEAGVACTVTGEATGTGGATAAGARGSGHPQKIIQSPENYTNT